VLLDAYLIALRCTLPMAMRALPLPRLLGLLAARRPAAGEAAAHRAIARSEAVARRLRVPDTCLYRALARFAALRRAGLDPRFRMGVRRHDPERGHAWVELGGAPVGEAADASLVETFHFP
jgi:hypothetical protein